MKKEIHVYEASFRDALWRKDVYMRMDAASPKSAAQKLAKEYRLPHNTLVRVEDHHCETHTYVVQEHTYITLKQVETQDIPDW